VAAWQFDGDLGSGDGIVHHSDGNKRNGSATWSVEADVARPPHAVFLQGDESKVESNSGCGEAPARCVVMVLTARHPARDPDLVLSLYRVVCDVAGALRRWVPHGGGLLGIMLSISFGSLSTRSHAWRQRRLHECETVGCCREIGLAPLRAMCCNAFPLPFEWSGAAVLISQSNWPVLS
jgi:hypothetical protein